MYKMYVHNKLCLELIMNIREVNFSEVNANTMAAGGGLLTLYCILCTVQA